jgi:ABC transport system ATP-binding/permease protein
MKIVLGIEYSKNIFTEISFGNSRIRIGRDKSCQLDFDSNIWSGVSRNHAEIVFNDGQFEIFDLDSKFGTFIDGIKISKTAILKVNSAIQLGIDGPQIKIHEIISNQENNKSRLKSEPNINIVNQSKINKLHENQLNSVKMQTVLELVGFNISQTNRYKIQKDKIIVGRSNEADFKINFDAAIVSREHLEIFWQDDSYFVSDLNSFNGTFLNGNRLYRPTKIQYGDFLQLGINGPFIDIVNLNQSKIETKMNRDFADKSIVFNSSDLSNQPTIMVSKDSFNKNIRANSPEKKSPPIFKCRFDNNQTLTIGRSEANDIRLDGLQISNFHARITKIGSQLSLEDIDSSNGVYVNGVKIRKGTIVNKTNLIQIGPYGLQVSEDGVEVFDNRSKTRIDVLEVSKIVPNNAGVGTIRLLDNISLTIQPNEFVGLLGPSGAGKSTFMDALNGMRPASNGEILINRLNLYQNLDLIKQSIGYVPQEDIIHRELTVYRTLYYVAKLRLSRDISEQEIEKIVGEVIEITGLSERREVPIAQLSGGQRKRVSIAVELITKPSIIYLDEPTSGLDPATEEKIMVLFRQIAESGRTVILTTHAMENVKLFDKIVLLMRGKLVFYGPPQQALAHVNANSFKNLYDKLEAPIEERLAKLPELPTNASALQKQSYKKQKEQITEEVAENWKQQFLKAEQYKFFVKKPAQERVIESTPSASLVKNRLGFIGTWQQWKVLAQRYMEVLKSDKFNLLILFGQAPIIALLTYIVVSNTGPRDFPFFMLALVAIWFGTSVSAREIIRERAVYKRERMINLGLFSFICSKLWVLSLIVGLQCLLLFITLKGFTLLGLMKLPGIYFGFPQLVILILTGMVGISIGLFVSATVKTSEIATSIVPLILIPQILFSGLVGVPEGISKYVGVMMPATWTFDEMKRLSSEKVLTLKGKDEKAQSAEDNEGRGLYKEIEHKNDLMIENKDQEMQDYRAKQEKKSKDYEKQMEDYKINIVKFQKGLLSKEPVKPKYPKLDNIPPKAKVEKLPEDISNYIDFLHPWGGLYLNPLILLIMFSSLIVATIKSLRSQDAN